MHTAAAGVPEHPLATLWQPAWGMSGGRSIGKPIALYDP